MAPYKSSKSTAQPPLVDGLLQYGKLAFNPELPEETRRINQIKFNGVIQSSSTLGLMPALNLLVQPGRTEPWLRAPLISALATLPLRDRGVQDTIEFILSVHPSSAGTSDTTRAGRGSGISHDALNAASRLLSSPPAEMTPDQWFLGIAPQLFSLLQGEGEPEMDRAAAFIIGFGILGRRQYGAPGMPGWKNFVDPILHSIDPTLGASVSQLNTEDGDIVFVGPRKVLVSSAQVARSLQRLKVLVTSHPHPSLTKRLLRPILLPLWALASWQDCSDVVEKNYQKPASDLLKTLLQLSFNSNQPSNSDTLTIVIQNLMFRGRSTSTTSKWLYAKDAYEGIQIEEQDASTERESGAFIFGLSSIDGKTSSFCALIESIPEFDTEISHLFIRLCRKWLMDTGEKGPVITSLETKEPKGSREERFMEAKLMQRMMTSVPEKLVSDSHQVLDLVNQILAKFNSNQTHDIGNEDTVAVALSLLNIILTSPNSIATPDSKEIFDEIQKSVYLISRNSKMDVSLTAQNLLALIEFRNTFHDPNATTSDSIKDQQYEDRKNYNLAMSYLTSAESPPPVRVQGLELISTLFQRQSSVLDIPALVVLFSSLLQDSDEYIYLRVIKSFIELSRRHPRSTLRDLIDRYVDPNEAAQLDQRLRFGEALLQVIQNVGDAFSGDISRTVSEGLMSIAGRRGFKPKLQRQQENNARMKELKDKEAEDAWDGPPPQLDEYLPSEFQDEDELLSQIISGWESKRGSEDVRIRASALSILGLAIETNVAGIGSNLISTAVDLSIHILTLEPEPERGILRRSAILLIMNFIRALDLAREQGRKLGFGLVGKSLDDVRRVLQYVEDTDNDGLVRQHARDVIEGLQAWQLNALLPSQSPQLGLQEMAGLAIKPGGASDSDAKMRPRIEELE